MATATSRTFQLFETKKSKKFEVRFNCIKQNENEMYNRRRHGSSSCRQGRSMIALTIIRCFNSGRWFDIAHRNEVSSTG